jgi:peroxiredoxin Q/BCP
MKRLAPNSIAPAFTTTDAFGQPVRLEDYRGTLLLLSFYRYASCPLCNLRIHQLLGQYPHWRECGLEMVAVFESPAKHINLYLHRHSAPFALLPDPDRRLYKIYGVQPSWKGFLHAWTRHLPMVYDAVVRKGFLPGRMDGDWAMVPADFLIGPDLRIAESYYGEHIGDHMPMERIERFLGGAARAAALTTDVSPQRNIPGTQQMEDSAMAQTFTDLEEQRFTDIDFLPGSRWAPLAEPVPGGSIHRLKMKGGSTIPPHTHPADEYVVLLSGDLVTGGRRCSPGTFWFTPANTRQGPHEAITDVELITVRLGAMGEFELTD